MRLVLWLFAVIVLWLLHLSNEMGMKDVHLTNIGDISVKDILKIADESTPADKRFVRPESTKDDDIEKETNEYYLNTPTDQEEKLVNLLKKRYKGTFPEYGRETESDYSKNMELEENLEAQPETVTIGHSDTYDGKNRDINDFHVPNLDTFDSDSNVLYPSSHEETESFDEKIRKPTKAPFYTTQRHKTDQSDGEDVESMSDFDEQFQPDSRLSQDKVGTSGADGLGDEQDGTMGLDEDELETSGTSGVNDEQDEALENEEDEKELGKMKEKLEDESFGLKTKPSHDRKNPGKVKPKRKERLKNDNSTGILHEFDELKKQHNDTKETGGNSLGFTHTGGRKHQKHQKGRTSSKKIQYIHTEDSQRTGGDAILDFLDRLLEKEPQKLRHDVLSIAKEMKNEENEIEGRKVMKQDKMVTGLVGNKRKRRKKFTDSILQNVNKGDEIDQWISEMEKSKGIDTITNDQDDSNSNYKNEDFKELHDQPKDIYSDHNGGGESMSEEPGNDKDATVDDQNGGNDNYNGDYKELHDQPKDIYPDNNSGDAPEETGTDGDGTAERIDGKSEKLKQQKYFDYEEFKEEALKMHNEFRRRHNAVALQWSDKLAKKAHQSAEQLIQATRSNFKRELEKHGQNIAILPYITKNIAKTAVEKWYSEITKFSFADPELKPETRDFTQIIWKGSKKVGVGFGYSPGNKRTVVVALYTPVGNKKEDIRANLNIASNDPYADIRKGSIEKHG